MKAVLFLHVLYLIFIKSFMVKGKCGSQVELRAVLLSCPVRDNGCEENDLLSQTMNAEQEQLLQANGKNFEFLKEKRTRGFPEAVKDCKRKLVITMKVKNAGKIACDDKYIVVDHVYDPVTGGRGRLLSPVVLKLRQEQMVQLYGLQFQRIVNNEPYEEQISKDKVCSISPDNPTCGITMYNGKPIPFSEGFCCSCSPHINAKRQLSPVSSGDSFIYSDSKLIAQGQIHLARDVEPTFVNPNLVKLRSKKSYDTGTPPEYLKRLNSDKIPNYLLEMDRKIICDRGDFMNELCRLREEKAKLNSEMENSPECRHEQQLTRKFETGTRNTEGIMTTQASVPASRKSGFMLKDAVEVLDAEPKIMPETEFKGSRGKRENRYETEDNNLEDNLDRFLRTKKIYKNRRKRLLEISHKRNQKKEIQEKTESEFPDRDYVKPLPPMFFFSHDKIVLNPLESAQVNITNKTPMERAYSGLKYALEQNKKWEKNTKQANERIRGKALKQAVSYDTNNEPVRENMKAQKYSLEDKKLYGKEERFEVEMGDQGRKELQSQREKQRGEVYDTYIQNENMRNNDKPNIRNYFLSRPNEFMSGNKHSEANNAEERRKDSMKDYNDVSKEAKENNENGYEKAINVEEKMRKFKEGNQNSEESQISEKTPQGVYEGNGKQDHSNRNYGQTSYGRHSGILNQRKNEDEAFDFNVEITHQNFPMVSKARYRFKSPDKLKLSRPEAETNILKTKLRHNKPSYYQLYEKNSLNKPNDIYIVRKENRPVEVKTSSFRMKNPDLIETKPERSRILSNYYRNQPDYFDPYPQYFEWPGKRQRQFPYSYDRQRTKTLMDYSLKSEDSQEGTRNEPENKIRNRRSVKEFEPAKGYLASDIQSGSDLTPHELDICPVETEKKTTEVNPIDINAEILLRLPKLKEKIAKLGIKKTQRSPKTALDRLIQSYLNAPEYVLKQLEALKEGLGEEEQNQKESKNSTCGKSLEGEYTQETAHCMRFGDLWYSMYSIKKPVVSQVVGLQLFDKRMLYDGRTRWKDLTKGKMIRLGTFLTSAEDDIPSVSLTFTGEESDTLSSPIDPSNYVLLVPSHLSDPSKTNLYPQLEGGPAEYLLVNRKDISSGGECNKIGTSFEAFARQPKRCVHAKGSCLKRQPIDLWREDMEARIRGKRGKYFVENFGTVPNSPIKSYTNLTGEYLAVEYYGDYTSTIEVELKADHNLILRNGRSNAQIPTVFIDGTYPKKTRIFMSVLNTGLTTSSFRPRLGDCTPDLDPSWCPLEGPPVTIPPQKRHDFKLDLSGALPANKLHATVQVLNQDKQPIAQRKIRIKRGERCMCAFHCKCNCIGNPDEGKTCSKLSNEEYRAAGYLGSPPFRAGPFIPRGFFANVRLVFFTCCYIMLMFGIMKGILGAYFRSLGIAGLRIITGPRKLSRYYEPELQSCAVIHDELGFPIHPSTCRPVQIVPLITEVILNIFFFFLYPIRSFWLLLKSSFCLKIAFGDSNSSRPDRDSDHKCCSPLLSQQNNCMNYNLTTITSKKCQPDEFLPYLPYRGDNDPLEEDDTEFVLQEMQKHKKK